jgi:hypothetical protein
VSGRPARACGNGVRRLLRRTLLLTLPLLPAAAAAQPLPHSVLAVQRQGRWVEWWRSEQAPARWSRPHPALTPAWSAVAPGVDRAELRLSGRGEAWRLRVVLVRTDPRRVRLGLERASRMEGLLANWSVDSAASDAVVAVNAGQFSGGAPWGWVVREGREEQAPGPGPLAPALVQWRSGEVALVPAPAIAGVRAGGGIANAFQSYPALLDPGGVVPAPLRAAGRGVDVAHRDSRLALGVLADGRLLLALTRFDALSGVMDELPFGPTTPEMAALMGALGCRQAMLLDGGISGQLLLRPRNGEALRWPGLRRVPLGLVVRAR